MSPGASRCPPQNVVRYAAQSSASNRQLSGARVNAIALRQVASNDFANAVNLEKDFQQEILLRATGCAPVRTSRENRKAKSAWIVRTRGAQIGTHPVFMEVPLAGPIRSIRMDWNGMRMDCKVKETKVRFL
jgi:hypothetical protein